MPLVRRTFAGATDLVEMQRLVAERTRAMGPGTNLHPGDVAHRIYSGLRSYNLGETVPVWEDSEGIAAFGIIWPKRHAFDVAAREGLGSGILADVVTELSVLSEGHDRVEADVIGTDPDLVAVLIDLGFASLDAEYAFTGQGLLSAKRVCSSEFTIRSVSIDDVEQLAAVHSGAFGSDWTPSSYLARMRRPGYDPADEIVAVAPDGTFAGFAMTWYDEVNKVGYFEPVGVHKDLHRRGVGTLLLREGMGRMYERGMTSATVWHEMGDLRSSAFYANNGFERLSTVARWERAS